MAGATEKRSFGLSAGDVAELAAEFKKSKKFPNPHRAGAYRFTVDALVSLGVNKSHALAKVHEAFRKAAGEEWYAAWAGKEKRDAESGKDADERFIQNLRVLQRTKDYGRKLLQVGQKVLKKKGAVIDLRRGKDGELRVALNTNSAKPTKPERATSEKARQNAASKPRKALNARNTKGRATKAATKTTENQLSAEGE